MPVDLLIPIAALLLYYPCLRGDFIFDDIGAVMNNRAIVTGDWRAALGYTWRPLTVASLALDSKYLDPLHRQSCRMEAFAFHVVNALIHGLNAVLARLLLTALGCDYWLSVLGAIVWLASPLAVNAVAMISNRASLLTATAAIPALTLVALHQPLPAMVFFVAAIAA